MFEKDKCNIFFVAPPFPNGRPVVLWPLRSAVLRQARPVHTPASVMTGVRDFVAGLARAGKTLQRFKTLLKRLMGTRL